MARDRFEGVEGPKFYLYFVLRLSLPLRPVFEPHECSCAQRQYAGFRPTEQVYSRDDNSDW